VKVFPKTDVVLVGLGAAGGIAAHVLTAAGRRVVALEVGDDLSSKDFIKDLDEIGSATMRNRLGDKLINRTVPTWRRNAESPNADPSNPYYVMNGVGGSSVHYGGVSWRLYPDDFRVKTSTVERYGQAALPAGSAIADWPVSYHALEPYYDKVEYAIGVAGEAGENPFEGPRSRPFPMPPLRQKGWTIRAHKILKDLG
jgi:gluconate 2-dehydrogenase alpha chain